ncbi:hypothetical protein D9758_011421 [Tetrapyrgos nigripes]|uniref:Uncharacterized protein n=1 Tax=Tetrapyrgos nigripes TaxID=182062 RepID=A0A8H5FR07_9AGAR|nr:hypothetical protein D9758_011421 [Tetrapyrgos nigripes]
MKFFAGVTSVALLPVLTGAVQLQFDNHYDDAGASLDTVACSDGANGLETRFGFKTFGDIPQFPHIGASADVEGFNSANCGACYKLSYTNANGETKSIHMLAIDHAGTGFNVAQAAMDELTGGQAVALGRVDVTSKKVNIKNCGL